MRTRELLIRIALLLPLFIGVGCGKSDSEPRKGQTNAVFNPDKTYGVMTDIDGNEYRTIQIGNQVWMAQNLRSKHFRNGDPIVAHPDGDWYAIEEPAYCAVNNCKHIDSIATFGLLYNGHVVADARQVAPKGWRIPTKEDVFDLISHLNTDEGITYDWGNTIVGGMLREAGSLHWQPSNDGADNSSGLSLLPTGIRQSEMFLGTNKMTTLYTSSLFDEKNENSRGFLTYRTYALSLQISINSTPPITSGCSIRCIKE
ncbi:fibrobacter succinogenes major paralogous domain-containing protein [Carboxylicivirga sp. N1Y90]|uniref:fibrobacter succinogenes major paralogous domain-containing protein n=1 Tax=Carboxylicivirga fragile TaxID=3417571 RepID=UPI003D33F3EE|nr:fibrobacter succinogenes major paralogous domain-containing protein [Marinilabiliaceae bacterium N1Y90]